MGLDEWKAKNQREYRGYTVLGEYICKDGKTVAMISGMIADAPDECLEKAKLVIDELIAKENS